MFKAPPVFGSNLKLINLFNQENPEDFVYNGFDRMMGMQIFSLPSCLGVRYNNEIYFYMSRGILNPNILESIPNQQVLQSIMIAPSILLSEAWESKEFKDFYLSIFHNLPCFYVANLFEDSDDQRKLLAI